MQDRGDQTAQRDDRDSDRAERHRSRVGQKREDRGHHRLETEAGQNRGRDRHRRAEACDALEQGAEAERDEQRLQPAIGGQAGERPLDDIEISVLKPKSVTKLRWRDSIDHVTR